VGLIRRGRWRLWYALTGLEDLFAVVYLGLRAGRSTPGYHITGFQPCKLVERVVTYPALEPVQSSSAKQPEKHEHESETEVWTARSPACRGRAHVGGRPGPFSVTVGGYAASRTGGAGGRYPEWHGCCQRLCNGGLVRMGRRRRLRVRHDADEHRHEQPGGSPIGDG